MTYYILRWIISGMLVHFAIVINKCFGEDVHEEKALSSLQHPQSSYINIPTKRSRNQFLSNVKSVRNSRLFLSIFCFEELLSVSDYSMDKKLHHILRIQRNYCIVFVLQHICYFHDAQAPCIYDRFLCKSNFHLFLDYYSSAFRTAIHMWLTDRTTSCTYVYKVTMSFRHSNITLLRQQFRHITSVIWNLKVVLKFE